MEDDELDMLQMPDQIFIATNASPMKLSVAASHVKISAYVFLVKLFTCVMMIQVESDMVELEEGFEGFSRWWYKVGSLSLYISGQALHLRVSVEGLNRSVSVWYRWYIYIYIYIVCIYYVHVNQQSYLDHMIFFGLTYKRRSCLLTV